MTTQNNPWQERRVIGDAVLYLGDALEIMAVLDPVPVIISDPPYGNANNDGDLNASLSAKRGVKAKAILNDDANSMREVVSGTLSHAARLLDPEASACCYFCGGGGPNLLFTWLANRMNEGGLTFFHSVIWDKINPGLGLRYRRRHEMMMVGMRKGSRIRWNPAVKPMANILVASAPANRVHPNQKPDGLIQRLVEAHSLPGDTVLDPFMGSGTTGVAALREGRRFIGIELDPDHFATACRRIEAASREPRMDIPASPCPEQISLM